MNKDEINIKITVNGQNVSTEKAIEVCRAFLAQHDKPARKRFVPPTVEEVRRYFAERGTWIDPDQFHAYYAARGWQGIKNWKACLVTWQKSNLGQQAKQDRIIEENNGHKPPKTTADSARYWLVRNGIKDARDWSDTECLAMYRRRQGLTPSVKNARATEPGEPSLF